MGRTRTLTTGRVRPKWSHPLLRNCAFLFVGGPTPQGFAPQGQTFASLQSGAIATVTPIGPANRSGSTTGSIFLIGNTGLSSTTAYTLIAYGTVTGSATYSALDDDNSTTRRYQFRINGSTGKVEFIPFDGSSNAIATVTFPTGLSAADMQRGFTMGAAAEPGRFAAMQNGAISELKNALSPGSPTDSVLVGARKTNVQGWNTGGISVSGVFLRAWANDELRAWAADPLQIIEWVDDDGDDTTDATAPSSSLSGSAAATSSGAGSLTTAISLAGAASVQASSTAALTTAVQLAGSAVAQSSGSGTIPGGAASLAGSASAAASGAAALSTSVLMAGAATVQASAAASLTTSISLAGAAVAQASAANLSTSPAPRIYATTIMRITTTNRRANLGAVLNAAAPIRSTGLNVATILNAAPMNRAADIGPATLNRTVSFP